MIWLSEMGILRMSNDISVYVMWDLISILNRLSRYLGDIDIVYIHTCFVFGTKQFLQRTSRFPENKNVYKMCFLYKF